MKLNVKTPQLSLSKDLLRFRPSELAFNSFESELSEFQTHIDNNNLENQQKTYVQNFLRDAFYRATNDVNSKGTIDLAIHSGPTAASRVEVIIEAKAPGNKPQMVSTAKPNVKAMHGLVLYFMRERIDENNIDLKYLIATNINERFLFSASDFNRLFYENKKFKKTYEDWRDRLQVSANTDHFYDEIVRPFIAELDETIDCAYFDLRDYRVQTGERKLIALFKILSPHFLLKQQFADDSNTLDKRFYTELLHIIGLEEYKDKSKTLIRRKTTDNAGSLLEMAVTMLDTKDVLSRIDNVSQYGATKDERLEAVALELCITWINRILFLKLLEAQLVNYHEGNAGCRFLNLDTIPDFDELFALFHQVLAKMPDERKPAIQGKFSRVPYLNSSLFEPSDLENQTITIESLKDHEKLPVIGTSILRKLGEKSGSLGSLEYLLRFLDAYDFASEGKEEIQQENRSLINASVLGKVFEKINGYKDGSIYTPGFITMYTCRQAIRLAVVQKFKETFDLEIESFDDLYIYISKFNSTGKILEFNAVIDSLKICDPAVGSGHFLVSALNEILAIKSELGIFADEGGKPFGKHSVSVVNDELIVVDSENTLFEYKVREGKPLSDEMQRLQSTLFHEKQKLIENCLFGVDINPNSVKIFRLRLWIELLKNAYYKPGRFTDLETLPNIDINIKEGNSLVSRFKLQDSFRTEATNKRVQEYRELVTESKNVKDKTRKDELKLLVRNLRKALSSTLDDETTEIRTNLKKKRFRIDELNSPELFEIHTEFGREAKVTKINGEIAKLEDQLKKVESKYANSFEWRFEFPEVLDDDGNFVGFDIVIGNPPYGISFTAQEKLFLRSHYQNVHVRTPESFNYFVKRFIEISGNTAFCSLIIPSSFLNQVEFEKTRKLLLENCSLFDVLNLGDGIFAGITAPTCIVGFETATKAGSFRYADLTGLDRSALAVAINDAGDPVNANDFCSNPGFSFINRQNRRLFEKCYRNRPTLRDVAADVATGISPGLADAFILKRGRAVQLNLEKEIIKKLIIGGEINRFSIQPKSGKEIIYFSSRLKVRTFQIAYLTWDYTRKIWNKEWKPRREQFRGL